MAEHTGTFAPLRHSKYRSLWSASFFSNLGSWFQITAASWLMLELTGSSVWVGWMTASRTLPLLVLGIPAGVIADRYSRSVVLVITNTSMCLIAAAMAIFTWMGVMTPALLLTLGMMIGVTMSFHSPSWSAFIPELIPIRLVPAAMALNSVSFNTARAIGPALVGPVMVAYGAAVAFGANAVSYVIVLVVLGIVIRGIQDGAHERGSAIEALRAGVRFAVFTPAFRRLLLIGAAFGLSISATTSMLPIRVVDLGGSAETYGVLLGVYGVGSAMGGMLVTRVNQRLRHGSIPITIMLTGASGVLFALAPTVRFSMVPMLLSGAFSVLTAATINGTVQLLSPDWVRGRAAALWIFAFSGIFPVGSVLSGVVTEHIGAATTILVFSSTTVVLGVVARYWGMQDPTAVATPSFDRDRTTTMERIDVSGGPVMVVTTWHIPDDRLDEFLHVMQQIRVARLATGVQRWQLYRDLAGSDIYNEVYTSTSWEEHLLQRSRLDDDMAALIMRARGLDTSPTGPTTSHHVGMELEHGSRVGELAGFDGDRSSAPFYKRIIR